jgi:hypothetical protein
MFTTPSPDTAPRTKAFLAAHPMAGTSSANRFRSQNGDQGTNRSRKPTSRKYATSSSRVSREKPHAFCDS